MPFLTRLCFYLSLTFVFALPAQAQSSLPPSASVASAHPAATQAGLDILAAGGNAFDAAVAVSAALAVVEPYSSGLGGGGFWLLHDGQTSKNIFVDGREQAPSKAHEALYQNANGEVDERASLDGALAAAIPGEPAALVHIAEHYGQLPLAQSLAPAIKLANEGFAVSEHMQQMLTWRADVLKQFPASRQLLLTADNQPLPVGTQLKQPDLAATLTALAEHSHDGFYAGEVAKHLVAAVQKHGGIWTLEDLANYKVAERTPITGQFTTKQGQFDVITAPPPSAGGITLVEALNILQPYPWDDLNAVQKIHLTVEALRRAYRDRAVYLGDPDFVNIPVTQLISPDYAAGLRVGIRMDKATPSKDLAGPIEAQTEGTDTTHFSILDAQGNYVAATLSVNYPFGSGLIAEGTGVILNDEMDDFSSKALAPNGYGLESYGANTIQAHKRPLSSMTPTFLISPDKVAILGTPGGSRIPSMVLLASLNIMHGGDAEQAVSQPRFHHQFLPDVIEHEPNTFNKQRKQQLKALGYELKNTQRQYGDMQAIIWHKKGQTIDSASDPRGIGLAK